MVPGVEAQGFQAQGSLTVDVEHSQFELRAPEFRSMRVWVNGSIACEPGTQAPQVYFRPDPEWVGPDGEHLRVEADRWDWQASQAPGSPNRYVVDRVIEATFNATSRPPQTVTQSIRWAVESTGFVTFPPACAPGGYRWTIARQQAVDVTLTGRPNGNGTEPDPTQTGGSESLVDPGIQNQFPTFGGRSQTPPEAFLFAVLASGAAVGLAWYSWRRR